ncbi:MAG: DUF1573 domain-containing protein [Chitinophagaceae bacterium]
MKLALSTLFTFLVFVFAAAQAPVVQSNIVKAEKLTLKESAFDFGKIAQGKPVTHVFEVVNTGNEILSLENVQASCGCTTPEWSKDPIAPGAAQKITVGYNAATEGPFEKSITVFYDKGQMKTILIKGNVWKTPDQSAPKNNSLAIFKN